MPKPAILAERIASAAPDPDPVGEQVAYWLLNDVTPREAFEALTGEARRHVGWDAVIWELRRWWGPRRHLRVVGGRAA